MTEIDQMQHKLTSMTEGALMEAIGKAGGRQALAAKAMVDELERRQRARLAAWRADPHI